MHHRRSSKTRKDKFLASSDKTFKKQQQNALFFQENRIFKFKNNSGNHKDQLLRTRIKITKSVRIAIGYGYVFFFNISAFSILFYYVSTIK